MRSCHQYSIGRYKIIYLFLLLFCFSCKTQLPSNEVSQSTSKLSTKEISAQSRENSPSRLDTISFEVEILRVIDGDTAEMLYGDLFLKIRLAHIDAPETRGSQAYGRASGRFLRKRIVGKTVILKGQRKLDGFGRFLATIYTKDGVNVNKELVEEGLAWHYKQYSKDESYTDLQKRAKTEKRGLWQDPNPIAPWEFRKGER